MASKTNFLIITSDQQQFNLLGKLNHLVSTPNLDALSSDGIIFADAYTPSPTCTPARCSLLTGQYPTKHGAYTIGTSLNENYPTVAHTFANNGYSTGIIGKAHFRACLTEGSFESAPNIFNEEFFKEWYGPYHGFEHAELIIGHTSEKHSAGMHYRCWLKENGVKIEDYFDTDSNKKYNEGDTWDIPEEYHPSCWTAQRTNAFIERAHKEQKPFFLWASFQDPHNPYITPEPWASMVNPDSVPLPAVFEGEMENKPFWYKTISDNPKASYRFWEDEDMKQNKRNVPHSTYKYIDGEEKIRKAIAVNMGMLSLMDKYIGKIIDKLKEEDLYENTAIIFTSDHGDYLGSHNLWFKGMHAYDECQRIPFIVRTPNCSKRGSQSSSLMNLVDIAPSFLSMAEIEEPLGLDGIDQSSVWQGEKESVRDWTMVEYRAGDTPFMQRTFITDEYKLVVYKNREYGELYNRKEDKHQLNNLWDNEEYASIKCSLFRRMVSAEMEKERVLLPRTSGA